MSASRIDFDQLRKAIDWSIRQLSTPRANRLNAIRQFVGNHYADGGAEKRVPTNFLELAVTIYGRNLVARAPRAVVSTGSRSLRPFAKTLELAINQVPDEIGLGERLRKAVGEALFSFAVMKVGICSSGETILGHDPGKTFVDPVGIDDYFCDMSARSRETLQFEGNDYWLPVGELAAITSETIAPDRHAVSGQDGQAKASSVSSDESADMYREKVWLRDVWIPNTQQVLTYAVNSGKLLRVIEWDGPERGPYHVLGFSSVPGNLLPLPPVALWMDLHELGNLLFRKLGRQADSKKTVAAFQGGNDESVKNLQKAADGEGITYSGPKPEGITVGGIDAPTLAFYIQIKDLFNYFSGNIDTMGGLAPATETVGQDRMLTEAATARLADMKSQTADFVRGIYQALAWYEWTDPVRVRTVRKDVPGTNISVKTKLTPEIREGDWLDYNFDIDVYSMQDDTPSMKLQKIGTALERYVFPALPLLQAQGGSIDFKALLDTVSTLGNIPELAEIVRFGGEPPAEGVPVTGDSPIRMPVHTTRTYERVNRPGATRHGKDDVLTRLLLGGKVQMPEAAALGRSAS